MSADLLAVPAHRQEPLARIIEVLRDGQNVVLTTHVNADGDGAGCEAAVAAWLANRGHHIAIVNPTPFPQQYRYLIGDPDWEKQPLKYLRLHLC